MEQHSWWEKSDENESMQTFDWSVWLYSSFSNNHWPKQIISLSFTLLFTGRYQIVTCNFNEVYKQIYPKKYIRLKITNRMQQIKTVLEDTSTKPNKLQNYFQTSTPLTGCPLLFLRWRLHLVPTTHLRFRCPLLAINSHCRVNMPLIFRETEVCSAIQTARYYLLTVLTS